MEFPKTVTQICYAACWINAKKKITETSIEMERLEFGENLYWFKRFFDRARRDSSIQRDDMGSLKINTFVGQEERLNYSLFISSLKFPLALSKPSAKKIQILALSRDFE